MAKRRSLQPWPETVWHSSGRVRRSVSLQVIRQHLQNSVDNGSIAQWRDFTPESGNWWWGFDAAWRTEDGDRVRARLLLSPDLHFVKRKSLTRHDLETQDIDLELYWALTAEADQPWNLSWRSPLWMFSDRRTYDWVTGKMPLLDYSGFPTDSITVDALTQGFEEMAGCPWYITVLTHDKRPLSKVTVKEPGLASLVPPSLRGRIVEFRFFGDQDDFVNADGVLPDSKLRLKRGGAVILPSIPRQSDWPMAEYAVRRPSGGDIEQLLKETAEVVTRYAELRPHYCDRARWGLEDLRESWVLPEIEVAPKRVLTQLEQAEGRIRDLEQALRDVQGVLDDERRIHRATQEEKKQAEDKLSKLTSSTLVQGAHTARQQAEAAWAAQEATDELAERLTNEVGWLRRQLAQVPGRSYDEQAPALSDGPSTWAELLEFTSSLLTKVRILDVVAGPMEKLDHHPKTKVWLRRTWEALEAYQAYAEAKETQGPEVLPHMQAYLRWELAESLFPESWHAPKEAGLLRRDPKYAEMRTFNVPDHGKVFMGEHVRVGGNRPPAPRMHVFDDTSGKTGLIWVGYIGPHLPNGGTKD